MMPKQAQLAALGERLAGCRICVESPLKAPLPHEPRPVFQFSSTAKICIAGQAPGTKVHESGRPFTDPSGVRLRNWMGMNEADFYNPAKLAIIPMGFCFPGQDAKGGDLPPRKECAAHWHDAIMRLHPQLELIVCIGLYAQRYHMKDAAQKTLTDTVRNWRATFETGDNPKRLPLPHPSWRNTAWLNKNPWFEREVLPVLRAEVARLTQT